MPALLALLLAGGASAQVTSLDTQNEPAMTQTDPGGPVPLRATSTATTNDRTPARAGTATTRRGSGQDQNQDQDQLQERDVHVPGEFERFVQRLAGPPAPGTPRVRRFGAELITGGLEARSMDVEPTDIFESRGAELSPVAPGDYVVAPGDEILLTIWGSVDADLRLTVDRGGRISVPRVGAIQVAGVRNAELAAVVERRVAHVFKNFQLSVSLGQLRGVRVFVTGFVTRPGTYTVGALSTVVGALMRAGGPSSAGSFRQVELKRGGALVARFDLYDLLLKGDRAADRIVQSGDVVHVSAVGTQVGLIGSVNQAAVFEVKPGETVADVLAMAGGFSAVADRSRLSVERLDDRSDVRIRELRLPADSAAALANGDVLRAFSAVDANQPIERQNKRVVVEGEVLRPGEYVLPPASSITDAVRAAGGLTSAAFVFGTEFTRESVRKSQQVNYDRAVRNLEADLARTAATQRTISSEEAAAQQARTTSTSRLIASLRAIRPTGRVVLQLPPDGRELPDLALEDGDRLYIPPRGTTVGVFGSVFNSGSYLFTDGRSVDEFLSLAGGPTSGADPGSVFVIRANGSVVSARQGQRWFSIDDNRLAGLPAQPGDTIFVPEEMDKTTFMQYAKDWTQILAQFALGVAAIQVLGN